MCDNIRVVVIMEGSGSDSGSGIDSDGGGSTGGGGVGMGGFSSTHSYPHNTSPFSP